MDFYGAAPGPGVMAPGAVLSKREAAEQERGREAAQEVWDLKLPTAVSPRPSTFFFFLPDFSYRGLWFLPALACVWQAALACVWQL